MKKYSDYGLDLLAHIWYTCFKWDLLRVHFDSRYWWSWLCYRRVDIATVESVAEGCGWDGSARCLLLGVGMGSVCCCLAWRIRDLVSCLSIHKGRCIFLRTSSSTGDFMIIGQLLWIARSCYTFLPVIWWNNWPYFFVSFDRCSKNK